MVDIHYAEREFLDLVISVSGAIPPWIEVQYVEERHDGVVIRRILTSLKVKLDPLFEAQEK